MKIASMMSVLVLSLLMTAACSSGGKSKPASATLASDTVTLSGTLQAGQIAAGAETTGWALTKSTGEALIDVDITAVESDAASLQGKRVDVNGTLTTVNYTTRGATPVLVAQKITLAK